MSFSAVQLKTIQEVITLVVFSGFSVLYLGDGIEMELLCGALGLMVMASLGDFQEVVGRSLTGPVAGPFGGVGAGRCR